MKKLPLIIFLLTSALYGATGDIRIQQRSAAGSWPDVVFNTANNRILGTNATGVPSLVTVGTGLGLASGTLTNAGVTSAIGTANQITASAGTGAVTFSLPTAVVGVNSFTAETTTNLTLAGGSSGLRATLGQGASGILTLDSATANFEVSVNFKSTASSADRGMTLFVANNAATQFSLNSSNQATSGAAVAYGFVGTSATPSGTPNISFMKLMPTVNWGGTPGAGTFRALHIAVTETALPTGTNHLIAAYAGAAGTTEKFSVTNGGNLFAAGTLTATTLNLGGATVTDVLTATAALDFGSILAANSADLTISVTGAAVGMNVLPGLPADPDASLAFDWFVSATNVVTVRAHNVGSIAVDQVSKTFRATVVSF